MSFNKKRNKVNYKEKLLQLKLYFINVLSYISIDYTYVTLYNVKNIPGSSRWANWTHIAIVRLVLPDKRKGTASAALLSVGSGKLKS